MPWELVEKSLRATHPYAVFVVRSMLSVPFFEKALYELPEARIPAYNVLLNMLLCKESRARVRAALTSHESVCSVSIWPLCSDQRFENTLAEWVIVSIQGGCKVLMG